MEFKIYNKETKAYAKLAQIDVLYCLHSNERVDPKRYAMWYQLLEMPLRLLGDMQDHPSILSRYCKFSDGEYRFSFKDIAYAITLSIGQRMLTHSSNLDRSLIWASEDIDYYKNLLKFLIDYDFRYEVLVYY